MDNTSLFEGNLRLDVIFVIVGGIVFTIVVHVTGIYVNLVSG